MHQVPQEIRHMIYRYVVYEPEGLRRLGDKIINHSDGNERNTILDQLGSRISQEARNMHLEGNEISFPNMQQWYKAMERMSDEAKAALRNITVHGNWTAKSWSDYLKRDQDAVRIDIDNLVAMFEKLPAMKRITLVAEPWSWETERQFHFSPLVADALNGMRSREELPDRRKFVILPFIPYDSEIPYMCWGKNASKIDKAHHRNMVALANKWLRNEA
jgi:hypothetical protein